MNTPWQSFGNTIVDPNKLGLSAGDTPSIYADTVILSAGTIGTTRILLQTAKRNKAIANPRIGRGLIVHPSVPMIGVFDRPINLLEGLDSATFVELVRGFAGVHLRDHGRAARLWRGADSRQRQASL